MKFKDSIFFLLCFLAVGNLCQALDNPNNNTIIQLSTLNNDAPRLLNFFIDKTVYNNNKVLSSGVKKSTSTSTFHLFSHGRSGELLIEGNWLSARQIVDWLQTKQLPDNITHLNIYGCNFAKGETGKTAVSYLGTALNISIAASDDITGKDGDWDLEVGTAKEIVCIDNYQSNLQPATCDATVSGNLDTDGDNVSDICDLDDDNDGILDTYECTGDTVYFSSTGVSTDPTTQTYTTAVGSSWNLDLSNSYLTLNGAAVAFSPTASKIWPNQLNWVEGVSQTWGNPALDLTIDDSFPDFNGNDAEFLTTDNTASYTQSYDDPDGGTFSQGVDANDFNVYVDEAFFVFNSTFQIDDLTKYLNIHFEHREYIDAETISIFVNDNLVIDLAGANSTHTTWETDRYFAGFHHASSSLFNDSRKRHQPNTTGRKC